MKGSMTVEAVFVMSLLLLVIMWILKESITMYQQTVETAMRNGMSAQEAVSLFRKIFFVKEVIP